MNFFDFAPAAVIATIAGVAFFVIAIHLVDSFFTSFQS